MNVPIAIACVGVLVFVAHFFSRVFERTKIPDVLFLMLIGLCLRPITSAWVSTHAATFGALFGALTLIAVLFDGGLDLPLSVISKTLRQIFTLTLVSFVATMLLVVTTMLFLTNLSTLVSFMFGAIVACTAPTVIIPLVRQIRMRKEAQAILSVESAISNVLSFVVTFALLDAYRYGELRIGAMVAHMVFSLFVACLFGFAGGLLWSSLFGRMRNLRNALFTTFAFVFAVFGIVEGLKCSGYIAALVFGVTLGNAELLHASALRRYVPIRPIVVSKTERAFFSEIVFLFKSFFFIYIGMSVELADLSSIYLGVTLTLLIFAMRIPVTRFSIQKNITSQDASFISAMAPKGIAVAALASIVVQHGVVGGSVLRNTAYAVVLVSITLTSLLVFLLTKPGLLTVYRWIFAGFGQASDPAKQHSHEPDKTGSSD